MYMYLQNNTITGFTRNDLRELYIHVWHLNKLHTCTYHQLPSCQRKKKITRT